MRFMAWGLTETGYFRSNNEDAYFLSAIEGDLTNFPFFLVADGLGGHEGGEVASRIAVERAAQDLSLKKPLTGETVKEAFQAAHLAVLEAKKKMPELGDMGTTMTALAFDGSSAIVGNAGDSRTYILREGHLSQITRDHSYVQELIEAGLISKKEARFHPYRNVVTSVLGLESAFRTELFQLQAKLGDLFLLATDGLTEELSDEAIEKIMTSFSPEEACQVLISHALENGGKDNITVILVNLFT